MAGHHVALLYPDGVRLRSLELFVDQEKISLVELLAVFVLEFPAVAARAVSVDVIHAVVVFASLAAVFLAASLPAAVVAFGIVFAIVVVAGVVVVLPAVFAVALLVASAVVPLTFLDVV